VRVLGRPKPVRAMKVRGRKACGGTAAGDPRPHHRPIMILPVKDLSVSTRAGTRKMVLLFRETYPTCNIESIVPIDIKMVIPRSVAETC